MVKRNIVIIDEEKCNGCGDCISACAEGAIKLIDGKAKLISETYCDGLGACLGTCPMGAITVEERECAEFDEEAVAEHLKEEKKQQTSPAKSKGFVCPGLASKKIAPAESGAKGDVASQLRQWPVQLLLVSAGSDVFDGADVLIAADCVAFAMGDFHSKMLKGRGLVIACPKLDDAGPYVEKLTEIFRNKDIKSLTVAHMEVPCCFGLRKIVEQAIKASGKEIEFENITVGINGDIVKTEKVGV